MALIAGIITPKWLVGYERSPYINSTKDSYRPTIGLYNHCSRLNLHGNQKPWSCRRFVDSLDEMPSDFWKASLVFLVFGGSVFALCVLLALIAFCVQNLGKKSLISVVGVIQAIAGLLLLIGMVLYPAGWGKNAMVEKYCFKEVVDDDKPSPFKIGECSIGWAFYSALGGTLLVFFCAVFSVQAEKSTSSDKVQDEIWKGKKMICLP